MAPVQATKMPQNRVALNGLCQFELTAPICTTIALLKEFEFLYDSSVSHHDSQAYFVPCAPPVERIDFSKPASSWLRPTQLANMETAMADRPLVEIPTGWNNEDMMALQYFPHLHNTHGHVDTRVVEQRWKDIFLWLWETLDFNGRRQLCLPTPDAPGHQRLGARRGHGGSLHRLASWLGGIGRVSYFL